MSIKVLSLHEHKIVLSYTTLNQKNINKNYKYEMHGWYRIEKNYYSPVMLHKDDYINIHCNSCNYKYISNTKKTIFTTDLAHDLFFDILGSKNLYTKDNKRIKIDNQYHYKDYYLLNINNKDILYIGYEKEINDYLFSEIEKYKELYKKEKSKNFNLNDANKKNEKKLVELNEKNVKLEDEFRIKEKIEIEKNELKKENDELKEKNINLNNLVTNYNNEENRQGEYDIVLCVDSIKNLTVDGWKIKYNKTGGKEEYEELKKKATIIVGVVGNGNKGKSFLLKKLSGYQVPMGYNVKTEGLSIIYGKTEKQLLAILDSAGQETPLLKQNKIDNSNDNNKNDDNSKKINKKDELEFEEYSRDKLVTELYIQQFILWKSNIIILLVGNITLSEQKLYARVKNEILAIQENQKRTKKFFIVHNLQNYYHKDDVNDYIENTLKKLCDIELIENRMYDQKNELIGFDKYFLEKGHDNIIHLLFINDYCEYADYYNKNTIWYLNQAISQEASRQTFEILENSKEFLLDISEQIMENKLKEEDLEIVTDKETKTEKLIINNHTEIQLKKFIVDEMGITKNDGNTAKYSYYINTEKSKFIVNIELPGGGSIDVPKVIPIQGYYSFRFEGEQNGELSPKFKDSKSEESEEKDDQKYEEFSEEKLDKIMLAKNLRKKHPIHIEFKISSQVMQLKYDSDNEVDYTIETTKNGIIFFIFDIILINRPPGKKNKTKIQL